MNGGTYALALLLIGAHMAYVLRVGGDHFEYRPLDFYWPLLALPAAAGIVHLGSRIASRLRPLRRLPRLPAPSACALVLFLPVLFYCNAFQGALLFAAAKIDERILQTHVELDDANAGWLMAAPGMPMLTDGAGDLHRSLIRQSVAMRFVEHREFANQRLRTWKPYENMENGVIPDDALTVAGALGIRFYYLPDLKVKVIDFYGLTDATPLPFKTELPLPEVVETAFPAHHVLAGADAGNSIPRERDSRHTSPVEYHAALVEIEVQVVEAVWPAPVGQVVPVNRVQGEEKHRLRVGRGARLLDVGQRVVVEIDVKVGAHYGFAGY